jgi:AcrR family transcriptional regulator
MTDAGAKLPMDGRHRRAHKSRDKIITAMLDLVEAGAIRPSAEDVAARAEVGLRSVFRHFKDMDSLYHEMNMRLAGDYALWLVPYESSDWRGQLGEAMDRRFTTYDRLLPFKRAADVHRHRSPSLQQTYATALTMMRMRLQSVIPPAFADNPLFFETLDMLVSFETWQRLRSEQNLSSADARAIVENLVAKTLAEAQAASV